MSSDEVPIALCVIEPATRPGEANHLIIPACPLCGGRHTHGGGAYGTNPRYLLGPRVAHCSNPAKAGSSYILQIGGQH
jgi:hypothetical protein